MTPNGKKKTTHTFLKAIIAWLPTVFQESLYKYGLLVKACLQVYFQFGGVETNLKNNGPTIQLPQGSHWMDG